MKKRSISAMIFIIVQMLSLAGFSETNTPDPIRLLPLHTAIVPDEFYIKSIIDARLNKQAIARLVIGESESKHSIQPTDLYGGGYNAIRNFMMQSVVQYPSKRPLNILIRECEITVLYRRPG